MTSRIYGVYNVYPSRDTRIFQGWDELASWFRRLKPNPDPAFHVVVEETNPGLFKGLIGYASGSTRSRGRPGLPSNALPPLIRLICLWLFVGLMRASHFVPPKKAGAPEGPL